MKVTNVYPHVGGGCAWISKHKTECAHHITSFMMLYLHIHFQTLKAAVWI